MIKLIAFSCVILLSACSHPQLRLEKLYFIDREKVVNAGLGKKHSVIIGKLIAEISSDRDLYAFANDRYPTVSFKAKLCDSNINIIGSPYPIIMDKKTAGTFSYQAILEYKSKDGVDASLKNRRPFNLSEKQEDICINGYFGSMTGYRKTNVIRYEIPPEIIQSIKQYEKSSGIVYMR